MPVLRTERLILDALTAADFDAYAAIWAEPAVIRYTSRRVQTRTDCWLRIVRSAGYWAMLGYGGWAVRDAQTGKLIGDAGFGDFHRDCAPLHDGVPEIGWVFHPGRHGQGLATEAVRAALTWADQHATSHPLTVCGIDPDNIASIRVAEKNGYAFAGMRRFGEDDVRFYTRPRLG